MPRGIAYQHDYFMLLVPYFEEGDEDGEEWQFFLEFLTDEIVDIIDGWEADKWLERETRRIAANDRISVGINYGGDTPALFVTANEWEDQWGNEYEYEIYKDVSHLFNKLIEMYRNSDNCPFGFAASSLHGYRYGKHDDGFYWYGCWDSRQDSVLYPEPRWFVGLGKMGYRQAFQYQVEPTAKTHPKYGAVIGPFRTKRAALFCEKFGANSICQTVSEYEIAAKDYVPEPEPVQKPLFEVIGDNS